MEKPTPTVQQDIKTVANSLKTWRSHARGLRYGGFMEEYNQVVAACDAFGRIIKILTGHTAGDQNSTEE